MALEFRPCANAECAAGLRECGLHPIEALAQQDACLELKVGWRQPHKRSAVAFEQADFPHERS
ncbi:MAG: hypothetical protein ABIZ49_03235, partial [Opitutaceae bacterium]